MEIDENDFISYITIKKGLSKNSIRLCKIRFKIINDWLAENSLQLDKDSLEKFFYYLKEKKLKNNSLNTYHFVFRYISDYLKDRGINNNFLEGFNGFKKEKPIIIILTPDEIEKILNVRLSYGKFRNLSSDYVNEYLNNLYQTFTMFLAYTGCRFDEASSLEVRDIDLSAGKAIFRTTKNKEYRNVYFLEPLISKLKPFIEGKNLTDYVFKSLSGNKIFATTYRDDLQLRVKKTGITKRVHPHLFRHSFATQLLMSGVDVTMVASLLGHKDIQTTFDSYVHLADETLKKAAFRHPLLRKSINPVEIIKQIRDNLLTFRLDEDSRFAYKIEEGMNSLNFTVFLK